MDFFRKTPEAVANLRAPIFEEKVIDHLLEKIKIIDKEVTVEELMKEYDETDLTEKTRKGKSAVKNP